MTFIEIEELAKVYKPINVKIADIYDVAAHMLLIDLYQRYRAQEISVEHAAQEKKEIIKLYEEQKSIKGKYLSVYKTFNKEIQISEEFRKKIHIGLRDGKNLEELFLLSCYCISVLTGDESFASFKIKEKLENRQVKISDL